MQAKNLVVGNSFHMNGGSITKVVEVNEITEKYISLGCSIAGSPTFYFGMQVGQEVTLVDDPFAPMQINNYDELIAFLKS